MQRKEEFSQVHDLSRSIGQLFCRIKKLEKIFQRLNLFTTVQALDRCIQLLNALVNGRYESQKPMVPILKKKYKKKSSTRHRIYNREYSDTAIQQHLLDAQANSLHPPFDTKLGSQIFVEDFSTAPTTQYQIDNPESGLVQDSQIDKDVTMSPVKDTSTLNLFKIHEDEDSTIGWQDTDEPEEDVEAMGDDYFNILSKRMKNGMAMSNGDRIRYGNEFNRRILQSEQSQFKKKNKKRRHKKKSDLMAQSTITRQGTIYAY